MFFVSPLEWSAADPPQLFCDASVGGGGRSCQRPPVRHPNTWLTATGDR